MIYGVILGSWPWPWRHRSRDHWTRDGSFPIGGPLDPSIYLSLTVSVIFRPKHHVLIDTMLNRHCACAYHVTCTPYVKFKYIFQFLAPTLPIHYVTFIGLRWRIRGVLSATSNFKGQIERNFKNLQNFDLLGALEIRWYEKLRFLLQKAHPGVSRKKSQKVLDSHRNDVSPLTQGLRYRAACDILIYSW